MTSLDLTRDWLRNVLQPYPSRDRILTEVLEILQRRRTLAVKTDAFTFDNGQTALLLLLHGTLPISYRGSTYHIPVHLWIPHEYPRSAPLAFVVPTKDMGVRKGREVDPSGRVREEVVDEWWKRPDKGIEMLLGQLTAVFSTTPPVFARPQAPQAAPPNAEASGSRPPPPPARPDTLPQYRSAPTPPPHPSSRQASYASTSPPVPERPRQASGPLPNSPPHVPQRPYAAAGPPVSPPGGFRPQQSTPPPQSWQPQQQQIYANGPGMAPAPPQPYPMPQPQSPAPQQRVSQPPAPQPPRPPPDLLSSPEQQTSSLPTSDPPPLPPSKPPPPSLLHLHSILLPHLNATLPALLHSLQTNRQHLLDRREDLVSGEPAIRDEMARLEAVKKVCDSVGRKMDETVSRCETRVAELEGKGEVSVDEVVCGISIVHNQLIDLVAEDNAIEDTIFHMTRALDAERIDLDRFVKSIRSLAREQYMKRALIERILDGMGQKQSW